MGILFTTGAGRWPLLALASMLGAPTAILGAPILMFIFMFVASDRSAFAAARSPLG